MYQEIVRVEEGPEGTFGVLLINGQVFCCTLEPPDQFNHRNISNIPPRSYICASRDSQQYGRTYQVMDVPGRAGILFHPGNVVADTMGCIMLGSSFGKLRGSERAILNSGETFRAWMENTPFPKPFLLRIREG